MDLAPVEINASVGEFKPRRAISSQAATVTAFPGRTPATLILNVPQSHLWTLDDPFPLDGDDRLDSFTCMRTPLKFSHCRQL